VNTERNEINSLLFTVILVIISPHSVSRKEEEETKPNPFVLNAKDTSYY